MKDNALEIRGLVGRFGVMHSDTGDAIYQFVILEETDDIMTVRFFSWVDGQPTDYGLISKSDLLTKSGNQYGRFFLTEDELRDYMSKRDPKAVTAN